MIRMERTGIVSGWSEHVALELCVLDVWNGGVGCTGSRRNADFPGYPIHVNKGARERQQVTSPSRCEMDQ